MRRKRPAPQAAPPVKPQQVTRIPPYRPGMWIKMKEFPREDSLFELSGRIKRVKSLTCSITSPDQKNAVWRVHFDDGRCIEWHSVERVATDAEARKAQGLMAGHGGA